MFLGINQTIELFFNISVYILKRKTATTRIRIMAEEPKIKNPLRIKRVCIDNVLNALKNREKHQRGSLPRKKSFETPPFAGQRSTLVHEKFNP